MLEVFLQNIVLDFVRVGFELYMAKTRVRLSELE